MKTFNPRKTRKSRQVEAPTSSTWFADWLAAGVVFILTVTVFSPTLWNDFVEWDDYANLVENRNYRGLGWTHLQWMFTTFHLGHYQPLSWMTFGFDYLLWGMDPFGYHLTNLIFHTINALMVYAVGFQLLSLAFAGRSSPMHFFIRAGAGFSAIVFAIHPLRVESVAWVTERRDVLSGFFILATIFCYVRANTLSGEANLRSRWMTGALVAYFFSLLSKASGMTLPVVLFVLDFYPLKRLGGTFREWFAPPVGKILREKIPFFVLAVVFAVIALLAQKSAGALEPFRYYNLAQRLAQAAFGVVFYIWKTLVPLELSPLYQLPRHLDPWSVPFVASGLIVSTLTAVFVAGWRRWPAGLAIWVTYVAILAPVLGIAQSGPQLVADRYSYLSCLGWAVLAGAGLVYSGSAFSSEHLSWRKWIVLPGMAVAIVIALGILTWQQAQVWKSSEQLWRHVIAVTEQSRFQSSVAHINLGDLITARGDVERALPHFRRAVEIDPKDWDTHYRFGNALAKKGDYVDAINHYRQALKLSPSRYSVHINLGNALAAQNETDQAIEHYREALQIDSKLPAAHYNLGNAFVRQGKLEDAVEHYRKSLDIDPEQSEVSSNLASALVKQNRLVEAMDVLQEAVKIDPGFADGYLNLGKIIAAQGDLNKAINFFRQAVALKPDFAEARVSLAQALAEQGKKDEAIREYNEAMRILKSGAAPGPGK